MQSDYTPSTCLCGCGEIPKSGNLYINGHNSRIDLQTRFWAKVQKTDTCWLWTGATNDAGYGVLYVGPKGQRRGLRAHRLSYIMHHGPIPDDALVCHSCDVYYPVGDVTYRKCVRPDHLFSGTVLDNNLDMFAKGRNRTVAPCGERQGSAKLTAEQVVSIRARAKVGERESALACEFGVTQACISAVVLRKNWRHLP